MAAALNEIPFSLISARQLHPTFSAGIGKVLIFYHNKFIFTAG